MFGRPRTAREGSEGTRKTTPISDFIGHWLVALTLAVCGLLGGNGAAQAETAWSGVTRLAQQAYPGRSAAPPISPSRTQRSLISTPADASPAIQLPHGPVWLQAGRRPVLPAETGRVLLQLKGPLLPHQRAQLADLGVHLDDYLPEQAWKATLPSARLDDVMALPYVHALGELYAVDKLPREILLHDFAARSRNANGSLTLEVYFHPDVDYTQARRALAAVEAHATQSDFAAGTRLTVTLAPAQVLALLALEVVTWVEDREPPKLGSGLNAARLSGIDVLAGTGYDLDGRGVRVGMWDEGLVDTTHPDFGGRVVNAENGTVVAHSTHVAGILTGSGLASPTARGMAPGVTLHAYDFHGEPVGEHKAAQRNHDISIANNSWGYLTGWQRNYYNDSRWVWFGGAGQERDADFGAYTGLTRNWDRLVTDTGLLVVKSIGNDRNEHGAGGSGHYHYGDNNTLHYDWHAPDGDYQSVGQIAAAKNVISVGSVNSVGTMSAFSAWGPTRDGRIKPDLVAQGSNVYAPYSGHGYATLNGTSMAAPVVSGALALLVERYRAVGGGTLTPQIAKALLVNTARDLGTPGPDYGYGWGLLDAQAAAALIDVDAGTGRRIAGERLSNDGERRFDVTVPPGAAELRYTLAWTDPAASPGAELALVNDLDLRLVAPSGAVHYPYSLAGLADPAAPATQVGPNRLDNVEQVRVSAPEAGVWQVVVRATRVQDNQAYAVVGNVDLPRDSVPPGGVYLALNSGASYALTPEVNVHLAGYDNIAVSGYYLSESPAPPPPANFTTVPAIDRLQLNVTWALSSDDGEKTLYAWLRDAAGNVSDPVPARIILDTQPPEPPQVSGAFATARELSWNWTPGTGGNGVFRYKLNDPDMSVGVAEVRDTYYVPLAPLSVGAHTLYVQERDVAGHWSAAAAATVQVDVLPIIILPPNVMMPPPRLPVVWALTPSNHARPTWYWGSGGGGGIYRFRLDNADLNGAMESNSAAYTPPTALSDGPHTLYVQERAYDGNWSPLGSYNVLIDTAPPLTDVSVAASNSERWVTLACLDTGSGCAATYYTLDGSQPSLATARYDEPILVQGDATLRFLSVDKAGNAEEDQSRAYATSAEAPRAGSGGGGGLGPWAALLLCWWSSRRVARRKQPPPCV